VSGASPSEMRPFYAPEAAHWYIRAAQAGNVSAAEKVRTYVAPLTTDPAFLRSLRQAHPESATYLEQNLRR